MRGITLFEHFTQKIITYIVLGLILMGIAVVLWNAIPGFIKVIAVIAIVIGFFNILKD